MPHIKSVSNGKPAVHEPVTSTISVVDILKADGERIPKNEPHMDSHSVADSSKGVTCESLTFPDSEIKGDKVVVTSAEELENSLHGPVYWEKRRKNNESAKRSREMRRNKEVATRYAADLLWVENQSLKREKATIEEEIRIMKMELKLYDCGMSK